MKKNIYCAGGMHLPGADSSRIIVGSWWLVVLVITTTYCGNLVAFLTFPKIDIPLRTIEDILEHKETISWSIAKNSYFDKQLKVTRFNDVNYRFITLTNESFYLILFIYLHLVLICNFF